MVKACVLPIQVTSPGGHLCSDRRVSCSGDSVSCCRCSGAYSAPSRSCSARGVLYSPRCVSCSVPFVSYSGCSISYCGDFVSCSGRGVSCSGGRISYCEAANLCFFYKKTAKIAFFRPLHPVFDPIEGEWDTKWPVASPARAARNAFWVGGGVKFTGGMAILPAGGRNHSPMIFTRARFLRLPSNSP